MLQIRSTGVTPFLPAHNRAKALEGHDEWPWIPPGEDGMDRMPPRQHSGQGWTSVACRVERPQRPRIVELGAVANAHAIAADSRCSADEEVGPDRWEVEPSRDRQREAAVDSGIEVDEEDVVLAVKELSLKETTPAGVMKKTPDCALALPPHAGGQTRSATWCTAQTSCPCHATPPIAYSVPTKYG
jgi:hypothetical protein